MAKSWEEYKSYRINKKKEEEEEKKRQQQQQQKKESTQSTKNSNNVVTYNRTIKPSAIQQLTSNPNNIRVLNREESQKVVNPDSLWEKIKSFAGDAERIDQNIGEGISNGLKDLWSRVYRARQTEIKQRADMFSQTDTMLANSKNENARNNGNRLLEMNTKTSQKATENMKEFDAKRREEKEKSQRKIAENISKQNNVVTKKMAELAPSIGNMGVGMVASAINPIAGTAYFTGSAAGSYYYDALDRGMTEEQADRYGNIMGALEGITEMIGVKNIQKGGRVVKTLASSGGKTALKTATSETVKTGTKEALKNFGIGIADNFMQESIMEPLQELTAQTTGGKDKANWENMGKRMLQSGIDGALTSIIMSGADAGSNICIGLEEKIQNGKKLTQQDIQQGVKDAEKAGVDVKKVSEDNLLRERDKIINEIQSNKQEENISNQVINQESKTSQNRTSQVEAQAKAQTNSNLAKVRQFYDENTFNQMKQFIETAPSQEALNQINEDIKTETKNKLEEVYKSEKFTESQSRKQTYAKYQRQNNTKGIEYNNDIVNNALDAVAANRNGRRTVGQWRQVAEQIGLEASNLPKAEIDNIAYGSWFDLQPTKNITQYDNRTKEHKGFEKFTSDDWINTIYESAKGQKLQKLDTVLNQTVETTQEQNIVTPKDNSEVMNEVQDYIKNNNLDMTTDEFVEWASNVELENEENMTQEQKELYSLINDIQNRTSGMYNENMVDFDKNTYLDYKNSNNITQDNQGRQLLKQQQEYFKNEAPIGLDNKGNLKVFYHKTGNNFNIIDFNKNAQGVFWFTDSKQALESGEISANGVKPGQQAEIKEFYVKMENPAGWEEYDKYTIEQLKEKGYDSVAFEDDGAIIGFVFNNSNQIKNVDNTNPTSNPDMRYELEDYSNNIEENEIQRKINRSMTMEQAKDMVQRAFVTGNIYDWFDGEYKNGDEWLAGESASDVALVIDNDFNLQNKYVNANEDILNEEYTIDDVIEAYQNGTLTGSSENQTQRLDTSKDTGYKDDRFYAPKDITGGKELYDLASQRVTNKNRNEIYKARADFIINAHNEGYIESLGLNSKEVYEKLRSWTSYPKNALQTSMEINKGVSKENRWTGIENCSVVNELSVSQEQLDSLVKEIKGTSDEYQRRYISNTMLALDTHLNYKNLTFDFAPNATNMGDSVLGDYQPDYDVIRVKRDGQNTVSHEMGHYIDHLIGRELANGYNLGVTRLCRSSLDNMMNGTTFTQEQKQFLKNFANFLEDIENSSDIGSSYKMSSDEVFARFVARFTEWTRNVATGNRYGYEAKWYDDHFNQSQYKEFAKLLQEYSLLKTTDQASGRSTTRASQRTGQIQEQKIEDIFNELNKKKKTQENTEQNQKVQLPMKEKQEVKLPVKENVQQTQENTQNTKGETINWNEIERPENNQKFRKHYRSIIESNQTTAEAKSIARDLMGTDTYTPETNKGQLAQADQRIMASSPETELQSLLSRAMNGEKISSVDIAVGERLIQYFSKTGNKQQLQEAIQATAMAGTSAGQTVQALSMLNHQTPQGQATWIQRSVDKMNKELAKRKGGTITTDVDGNLQVINKQGQDITNKVNLFNLTPEMIDKIMNSENQEQMYKNIDEVYEELGKQVPQSMLEKVDSWRYFSMLANARTHIRNMVGNVAMGKMQRVKDKIAGGIEDVVSKFNPDMERTKTLAIASKKTRDFVKQDFKNMEVQSRLELNENKYNPQSRLQNARRTFKSDGLENTLGRLFNLNDKLLSAEDGIGLKAGYQKALADYITANKIDVDNITDAQLGKARNYAIQQAKEATFHQASAIASAITQFQNKNKATKFFVDALLPFKKTPINIAKAGMEYSPLQIAKSATLDVVNLRKGNISINQYIDNLAKGMTGTGIALVGYALANAGILKASGGDDKDKEKFDEEQGKQSYSIEIAGKTYSLDWLAPTGIPLFIGAETFKLYSQEDTEKSTEKSSEEDRLNQAIKGASNLLNAGATAINPMSEMSMISGLTSALSSYNTSDNLGSLGNMMTNMGKSYVNQFFPTLMGQVAKTGDEYERTTKSTAKGTIGKAVDQTINQIKAKVPGLRQTLPIKTDIWGKEVKQEVNLPLRAINNFVNPATVKQVSTDKVDMELNKLYEENHNASILPDILTKTVQLNKQTYRLNNKEYAEFTKNYGQTSHQLIEDFIKTSDYDRLTQEQKETAISNIYSYAKEQNKMDYAKKVNEEVKPSTLYTTMKSIEKGGGKQSEYLNYLAKTKGMSKESEKNKVLANSSYSNKTKEIIYTNGTGKDDDLYNNLLSKSNINMTEYLNYKNEASDKAFSADKDKNGKTITGSGKKKVIAYLNNNITGSGNRLLIAGKSYALQNNEKQKLAQYINQIATTKEERLAIYNQLDKNFTVKDGKVYMKVSKK